MKRWINFFVLSLVFGIVLISFAGAGFQKGNLSHSIEKSYAPGSKLKGWINISLTNEPANSLFTTSEGNSISLIELIRKNPGYVYSCNVEDCESDYLATSGEISKDFALNNAQEKIFGFKLTGQIQEVKSVNFSLISNAQPSCTNQLEMDFFNEGEIDFGNNKASNEVCNYNDGCYNDAEETTEYNLGEIPYCQKMNLTKSPGFKLGAWVKRISGLKNLSMELWDGSEPVKSCNLSQAPSQGGDISCDIDYLVTEEKEYSVCIYSKEGSGEYRIKGYTLANGCGFYDNPPGLGVAAYKIFAQGKEFNTFGTLKVTDDLPSSENILSELIYDYIGNKYSDFNCPPVGCIIPVKLISKSSQDIWLRDLKITYVQSGEVTETKFYDLTETPAKVNANFQKMNLDEGNFSVKEDFGNYTAWLKLNNIAIFTEEIFIERIPEIISVTPTNVAAGYPTEFTLSVDMHGSSANITSYVWNFNHTISTTATNKVTYTHASTGTFSLIVNITDSNQFASSKTFSIAVETPINAVNSLLAKRLNDLNVVKTQINEYPVFYKNSLDSTLSIQTLETKLVELQRRNATASSDQSYISLLTDLIKLEIPEAITISTKADAMTFFPKEEDVNLEILQRISTGNTSVDNSLIPVILAWNQNNMDTKITFKEFSAKYSSFETPLLRIFEINANKKSTATGNIYFILNKLENLSFQQDYSERNISDYIYTRLTETSNTIVFSTTSNVDFTNLPLFISPETSALVISNVPNNDEGISKWVIFSIIMFFLIVVAIGVYLFLQNWYKKRYENYLFKNKNDLYNMISYIANGKRNGISDSEIASRLKKSGWGSEQVDYVMRKYSGKRTGMPEISFLKKSKNINTAPIKRNFNKKF